MISYYKQSRLTAYLGGAAAGIFAACAAWLLLRERLPNILPRLFTAGIAAFVAINVILYVARLLAMRAYQTTLLLLYEELDPTAFLQALTPMAAVKTDASTHCTTMVHIANGYLYGGNAKKAIETLLAISVPEKAFEMRGLIESNLATCYLALENADKAQLSMTRLQQLLTQPRCKKEFVTKGRHSLGYLQICLAIVRGKHVDSAILEHDFEQSRSPLHKVDVQLWLAKLYRHAGNHDAFLRARDYVIAHGNHLCAVAQAEKML